MSNAVPLPSDDDTSAEDSIVPVAPWTNPSARSRDERLAQLDEVRELSPPQRSRSLDLLREDRRR